MFHFMKYMYVYTHTTFSLSIHLLIDTKVASISWQLIINSAIMNTGVLVSLQISIVIFLGIYTSSGIARPYGTSLFSFLGNLHAVLHSGCTNVHAFLQGIFPTQRSNPGLLHGRQILYHLSHLKHFLDKETLHL